MDRRGFLKRLLGTAALVVATKVGISNLTAEDFDFAPTYNAGIRGLAYHIKSSGTYFGIHRSSYGESE